MKMKEEQPMSSLILRTATSLLLPLLALFSIFLLFRGHNHPGGGFSGGLMGAAAFALFTIGYGGDAARRLLRVHPHRLLGAGLLLAILSGVIAMLAGKPFLTGMWIKVDLGGPELFEIGTPLLFDTGVYLVVVAVTLNIVFSLAEE
jgi:multicomponent Na+:H+ antiporter subunit B